MPSRAIAHIGGDDDRSTSYLTCVQQRYDMIATGAGKAGNAIREHEFGTKQHRLVERAQGQLRSADAQREAQVVPDQRAGAGLPADGLPLHHERGQAFGGGVHRRGKSGRTGADEDVIARGVGMRPSTERRGSGVSPGV
jgi:hypothetical protein